ncbi:serine protease inhibitor [Capsulimonas corticalis]|uniref:Serine protease inhibitor n=1 Tax=Capsulimonas corticalis TaxID=2219043 RepID=A0A402D3E3_9BACT|nr:serine protease inhibitor [Capsulimonas corticalis]
MTQVATAANAFGIDLLGKLTKAHPDANCFISPYSVQQALLLADNGAGGITRKQIGTVLHLGTTPLATINIQTKALRESLTSADPKVKIDIANALWADHSFLFTTSYQETCQEFYDAHTQSVALRKPSGAAAINAWVKQKTENKISEIVTPAALIEAVAVLTNAVYFHGSWTTAFKASDTHPQTFHLSGQSAQQIPTMRREGAIDYAKSSDWEAVALPYGGGRLRMIAVLPAESSSLSAFVETLSAARWSALAQQLQPTRLSLFLPKVHVEYSASLKPALDSLGMRSAFRGDADFTAMGSRKDLLISDVLHKTTLDVDEEGTTASAATAVIMTPKAIMLPPPLTVRIDRPFFCAIQDTQTGAVLFAGAIRKPQ